MLAQPAAKVGSVGGATKDRANKHHALKYRNILCLILFSRIVDLDLDAFMKISRIVFIIIRIYL